MSAFTQNNPPGRRGLNGNNCGSVTSRTKASHYRILFPDGTECIKRSFHCHEQTGVAICYQYLGRWYAATIVDEHLAESRFKDHNARLPAVKVAFQRRWF